MEDRIETEFLQGKLVPSLQSSPTHEGLKIETKDDDSDHPSEKMIVLAPMDSRIVSFVK